MALRQPIVSVMGHVDHGKTTLIDIISGTKKADKEAGGITQRIRALEVPLKSLEKLCQGVLPTENINVPGLLFIDTPGHRAFISMRRRGGSLADIAVLVVAMNEGFMPQTREVLQILRHEKTPFIVAVNKLDLLPGYRPVPKGVPLVKGLGALPQEARKTLDERIYAISADLYSNGFSADRYDRVSDYARNIALIPISAKTGAGVPDLLALIVGLAQKFLATDLAEAKDGGEATILERSEEKGLGAVASLVLYRGRLKVGDVIAVNGTEEPFLSKVRALYKHSQAATEKFASIDEARAAAGLFVSAQDIEKALPGGIVKVVPQGADDLHVLEELNYEANPAKAVVENGVWLKADTLGSLDALLFECQEAKIPVKGLEVGAVSKREVTIMSAVKEPTVRSILAFNVEVLPEAASSARDSEVNILSDKVIFHLIEEYQAWRDTTMAAVKQEQRKEVTYPAKLQVMPGHVFRASKPAIVGVRVMGGTFRPPCRLMDSKGEEVGTLKGMQDNKKSVSEGTQGMEISAAIDGATVGRTFSEGDMLYTNLKQDTVRMLKGVELTPSESTVLTEIISIQRSRTGERFWGV